MPFAVRPSVIFAPRPSFSQPLLAPRKRQTSVLTSTCDNNIGLDGFACQLIMRNKAHTEQELTVFLRSYVEEKNRGLVENGTTLHDWLHFSFAGPKSGQKSGCMECPIRLY